MNDQMLVQYLLGLLRPEDAERLDEASMVDDEIAARLRLAEQDLVDAYVRGRLTGEMLTRFESHYLSSPRRRDNVAFARRFVPAVDRAAASQEAATRPPSTLWTSTLLTLLPRRPMLAAAAALVLITSGALLFQTVGLRRGPRAAQAGQVPMDQHAGERQQRDADPRTPGVDGTTVARAPEGIPEPAAPPAQVQGLQSARPIALVLLPQTRSIGPISGVSIPSGADRIGLELRLESNEFPRYQVGLRDPAVNAIVWRSGWIAARSSGGENSVRVAIPSGTLKPQHYSLDLNGRRPGGGAEVVGSYVFEIVPR
jgi:hypothetical protein